MKVSKILQKIAIAFHLPRKPARKLKDSAPATNDSRKVESNSAPKASVPKAHQPGQKLHPIYHKEPPIKVALCALSGAPEVILKGISTAATVAPIPGISYAISLAENVLNICQVRLNLTMTRIIKRVTDTKGYSKLRETPKT